MAQSGQFNDLAFEMCGNLIHDPELLVQKGVGWSLKDLMRSDRERVSGFIRELRDQGVSSTITLYALKEIGGEERARLLGKG